jgi:hypothetical protein
MIQNKPHSRSCWSPEDLDLIQQRLSQSYPHMGPILRNAIVMLSMDEVRPSEGVEALQRRAASFARHCPAGGIEQMLAS